MLQRLVAVLATALLAVGLTVGVAAPASAHTPNYTAACAGLQLDLRSYGGGDNYVSVTIDGTKVADRTWFRHDFATSYPWSRTAVHSYTIVIDAADAGYDRTITGTSIPCASTAVTCDVATLLKGSPLSNGDHINMDVVVGGVKRQVNAYVDIRQAQDPASESGLVVRLTLPSGQTRIPLSTAAKNSGVLAFEYSTGWTGSWTVEWAQFNSSYFNQNRDAAKFLTCSRDTPVVISAVPTATAPTCSADGSLVLPAHDRLTWSGGATGDGPGTYTIVATPAKGYTLGGAQDTWVVQVLPKGTGLDCGPPPCIASSQVTYTYDAATNSGTVTVPNPVGSSGELCDGFWVTAVSWKFTTDTVWPQALDRNNPMPENDGSFYVDEPGTYHYAAAVECGQGDIYASYEAQPVPTAVLNGPNTPYQEHFLHDMGFTGPTPTYTVDAPGCNEVVPVAPQVTPIAACGTEGSLVIPTTPGVVYALTAGDGKSGRYEVTATPAANHYFAGPQKATFTGDLGSRTECAEAVEPKLTDAVCDARSGVVTSAFITVPDTTGIEYRIGTTVLEPGDVELPVGETVVTATAATGYTNTGPASFTITVSDDPACDDPVQPVAPTVSHEVCDATTGEVQGGELTFTRVENLSYTVDGVEVEFPAGATTVAVPVAAGEHTVGYRAADGFFLAGTAGLAETADEVTVEKPASCDKPQEYVAPRVTGETCDAAEGGTEAGTVVFELVDHLGYVFDGTTVTADSRTFERPAGEYTLVVTAADGYFIAGTGATTKTYTVTVAAPAAACDEVTVIPLDPFANSEECAIDPTTGEGFAVDGSITIVAAEHVTWTVTDVRTGAVTPVAVEAAGATTFARPAGEYLVTAIPDPGYLVTTPTSFALTVREPALPCDLDTHAELESGASWTDQVCTAGGLVDPTITVAPFPGVSYFIDGRLVTTTTTTVAPGEHLIEARADDPSNTVTVPSWNPTLLAASTALCGDLTTLALTGETPGGWLLLAVVLLQAGVLLLAIRLVRRRPGSGRHLA